MLNHLRSNYKIKCTNIPSFGVDIKLQIRCFILTIRESYAQGIAVNTDKLNIREPVRKGDRQVRTCTTPYI